MIIQHNLPSMFTSRQLVTTNRKKGKNMERLASGYKINRASDDAAGLTISEKMRWQIRGLNAASSNCQDGISFCQVADGAMSEMQDMIHRMKELSIQAANDTNTVSDRTAIQAEIDQIKDEMARITDTTEFNTISVFQEDRQHSGSIGNNYGIGKILGVSHIAQTSALNEALSLSGTGWSTTGDTYYTGTKTLSSSGMDNYLQTLGIPDYSYNSFTAPGGTFSTVGNGITYTSADNLTSITLQYNKNDENGDKLLTSVSVQKKNSDGTAAASESYSLYSGYTGSKGEIGSKYGAAWLDFSEAGIKYNISSLYGEGFNSTCATCSKYYSIKFTDGGCNTTNSDGVSYNYTGSSSSPCLEIDISDCLTGEDIVQHILSAVNSCTQFNNHYTQYAVNDDNPAKLYLYDNRTSKLNGGSSTFEPVVRNIDGTVNKEVKEYKLWIQSGSKEKEGISLEKPLLNNNILGIDGISVLSHEEAKTSISQTDSALAIISRKRSLMGAYQNRLEYAAKIDDNISENTQNAESRLRDLELSGEIVDFSKNQILEQAAQAMLAQANNSPNGILELLRK